MCISSMIKGNVITDPETFNGSHLFDALMFNVMSAINSLLLITHALV